MAQVEKSGVHLTGADSGWPVASDAEPMPHKDGTGTDDAALPDVTAVAGNALLGSEEFQRVHQTGGDTATTFTLTFSGQTTTGIAKDATAATVQTALEALNNIAPGDVDVDGPAGGPYEIRFLEAGAYGDSNTAEITGDGVGVAEVQTITISGTPTGGNFTLEYNGQVTDTIAYNAAAAAVDSALEALSNIGAGDVTCTGGALPGTPVTVTFSGALGEQDVRSLTVANNGLTGGTNPSIAIATGTPGKVGPTVTVTTQLTGS